MNVTSEFFSVARGGTFTVNDTTEVTKNFYGFFVADDSVITSLKVDGIDVKTDYIQTPGTAVVAGQIITCKGGAVFSGITISSGQVSLVVKQ